MSWGLRGRPRRDLRDIRARCRDGKDHGRPRFWKGSGFWKAVRILKFLGPCRRWLDILVFRRLGSTEPLLGES